MDKFKSNIDDKALEDLNNKITNARLLDWGEDYTMMQAFHLKKYHT